MSPVALLILITQLCLGSLAAAPLSKGADGKALFRANCAFCHGMDARGGRGANLLGPLNHGATRKELEHTIKEGIAGSEMNGFDFEPEELSALLSYLEALRRGQAPEGKVEGDRAAGRLVYDRQGCSACHEIGSEGSVLGPDLSRVGASRSVAYLRQSIVNPSADISDDYRSVKVTTLDGATVTGIRVNEDSFTVQLRLPDQRFHSFLKSDLRNIEYPETSLMPAYSLAPGELANLVAYLASLRAQASAEATVAEPERGIR